MIFLNISLKMIQYSLFLLFIQLIFSIYDLSSSFNIEEMKYINYDVDISVIPVKKEETNYPVIYLTSRSGQEFQCKLPQLSEDEITEKEVVNEKNEDVLDLLKPMKSGPCLSKSKDWWTYEFCFGHYIKQFHVEDGQIIGQVLTLGLYESDYDWNNETSQEKFKNVKQRYHSQYYTNGTKCDLTGQPRNAEVRIYCEEDAGDYIYRVDEPGTCSYVIVVHTSRLCSHPLLKPLPSSKAHSIPCHPLLNNEQYSNYQKKLKEQKALEEEKRNKWLSNQQERLQEMKNMLQAEEDSPVSKNLFLSKSSKTAAEKLLTSAINQFDKEIENLKKIPPSEKLKKFKRDMQQQYDLVINKINKVVSSKLNQDEKDISFYRIGSKVNKINKILQGVETDLLKSIEALKEIEKDDEEHASKEKMLTDLFEKEKKDKWSSENRRRLQELLNLLHVEENPLSKKNPYSETAKTFSEVILLSRIRDFQEELEKAKKFLPPEKLKVLKDDIQKKLDAVSNKVNKMYSSQLSEELNYNSLLQHLVSQLASLTLVLKEVGTDFDKATKMLKDEIEKSESGKIDEQTESAVVDDDKLQVRIRRLERKSSDTSGKLHEMDFEQREKLEQAVKEKLEKSGLDTGGRKIEVKIITAGYYDNEDGKDFETLTEEETDQFQNMIMALLTGQQEAVQEMKRHKKLEENYQFIWDDNEEMENKED